MQNSYLIVAAGLTKVFRDFWMRPRVVAVDNLDLAVAPKQVFGLLGPNGSGKSTTIKLILGLLHPTRGKLSVLGRPPSDVTIKKRIGFLPEESYLYRHLTARETLDFYGQIFRLPYTERKRRIDMLLDMVGLSAVAHRRVGEYSKGMARRIGLAQALINDPDLVILDEPTTGLDPIGTRQIKDLLIELKRRGKTVILSSHLLADVEDVCDDLVIMYGGKKRAGGQTQTLLAQDDKTQITAPLLRPQTVERIRVLIAEDVGSASPVQVGHPSDRLESLFMRIVRQAEAERLRTSGAVNTGRLAEFLTAASPETEQQQVLAELVQPGRTGTLPVAPNGTGKMPVLQKGVTPDQTVLGQLTGTDAGETQLASEEQRRESATAATSQVDPSVLSELLSNEQGKK